MEEESPMGAAVAAENKFRRILVVGKIHIMWAKVHHGIRKIGVTL